MPARSKTKLVDFAAGSSLLAKSPRAGRPGRTLVEHTLDVIEAFEALFGTPDHPTDLAIRWASFFRLSDISAFLLNGLAACIEHDWGKATNGFQGMLLQDGVQLIRHEQISAVLITWTSVWEWLGGNPSLDRLLVLSAVVGHHLKARITEFGQPQAEIDTLLRVWWENTELRSHLSKISTKLNLSRPVPDDIPKLWRFEGAQGIANLADALDEVKDRLERLGEDLEQDEARRRLLWAVRAGLIVADAAGSGLFRQGMKIQAFIQDAFANTKRLDFKAVARKVIQPRKRELKRKNLWRGWNDFQRACGDSERVPSRALLLAPCGSGKTLAAWRWIAARCGEQSRGRAIFLYPTRGTATEGYRDYVSYAGPEEAALVHGTADFDLEGIHPDIKEEDRINEARLFALRQWPKRLFSATVDQFLGFLQHGYGPTCLLPLLADSVVVFDEVHSYDRGMFSALLQFLENFDVPALCMTATLLEKRREKLAKYLTVFHGLKDSGGDLKHIADYPRYEVSLVANAEAAEKQVRRAIRDKRRVLWVVNTVDRAQRIAAQIAYNPDAVELADSDGVPVFCYHSRYLLEDRRRWHERVLVAFRTRQDEKHPVLALTTQVCEMSLDLDADLLVTEYAPPSSLVQRMGRCCRDTDAHKTGRVGQVAFYRPENENPYSKQDFQDVDAFVTKIAEAGRCSQSKLEDLLTDVPQTAELPKECRFLQSGPWAAMGEEIFRDIDDYTRQAVLDPYEYLRLRGSKKPWAAQGAILPLPKKYTRAHEKLPSWLHVASGGYYRPGLGYGEGRPAPTVV